jgi:hypothetical protein
VARTVPDSNASRQWRIVPSRDLDAEELDVTAAAQLELEHELEPLERRNLALEAGDSLLDQRLGVRGRHVLLRYKVAARVRHQ